MSSNKIEIDLCLREYFPFMLPDISTKSGSSPDQGKATEREEPNPTIITNTLGRPIILGGLYNRRNDRIIPGM